MLGLSGVARISTIS